MKSALNLHVERLEKPSAISFDVRPQAVKNWVDALPMGHVGEATRQIYTALRETNGLEIDGKLRFDLLESLWGPVHAIMPALFRHFSGSQFPLPKKAQKVAQLSTDLQAEILVGYRLALEAREQSSWFGRKAAKKQKATSAHRLLHYLEGVLENYRVLNLPAPKNLWRELHRVYIESIQMAWLEEPITTPDGAAATTVEQEYKQILLLNMLPMHMMRPDQIQSVRRTIGVWAGDLQLPEPGRGDDRVSPFCILLNMDMPPIPNDARCRKLRAERASAVLFDSSRIMQRLATLTQSRAATVTVGDTTLSADTLAVLSRSWGEPPARAEERQAQDFQVDVAIGLSAVSYLMRLHAGLVAPRAGGDQPQRPPVPDFGHVAEEIELSSFGGTATLQTPRVQVKRGEFVTSNEHNDETWGQVFDQSVVNRNWAEQAPEKEYSAIVGRVQDASENGYRVSLPVDQVEQVKVGDLAGIFEPSVSEWRMGSIRWVRQEDERELQIGVQIHMSAGIPLDLLVRHGSAESAPQRCLLGLQTDGRPLVIMPALPGIADKRLALSDQHVEAGFRLAEKVAGSALFEAYLFEITGAKVTGEPARTADLLFGLVRRYLPDGQKTQAEPVRTKDDEYSNIWSTL